MTEAGTEGKFRSWHVREASEKTVFAEIEARAVTLLAVRSKKREIKSEGG